MQKQSLRIGSQSVLESDMSNNGTHDNDPIVFQTSEKAGPDDSLDAEPGDPSTSDVEPEPQADHPQQSVVADSQPPVAPNLAVGPSSLMVPASPPLSSVPGSEEEDTEIYHSDDSPPMVSSIKPTNFVRDGIPLDGNLKGGTQSKGKGKAPAHPLRKRRLLADTATLVANKPDRRGNNAESSVQVVPTHGLPATQRSPITFNDAGRRIYKRLAKPPQNSTAIPVTARTDTLKADKGTQHSPIQLSDSDTDSN